MIEYYTCSMDHIRDEQVLLDLMLYKEISRGIHGNRNFCFKDMPHIKIFLERKAAEFTDVPEIIKLINIKGSIDELAIEKIITKLKLNIYKKIQNSNRRGIRLRLKDLVNRFNLSITEESIVLLCFSVIETEGMSKLISLINENPQLLSPTKYSIEKIFNLSGSSENDFYSYLSYYASLFKHNLCRFIQKEMDLPFMKRQVVLSDKIYRYLKGEDVIDSVLSHCATLVFPEDIPNTSAANTYLIEKLSDFINTINDKSICYHLYDGQNTGDGVPRAVAKKMGQSLLIIDSEKLLDMGISVKATMEIIQREVKLTGGLVCFKNLNLLLNQKEKGAAAKLGETFINAVLEMEGTVFFFSNNKNDFSGTRFNDFIITIDVTMADHEERNKIWQDNIRSEKNAIDQKTLISPYELKSYQIKNEAKNTKNLSLWDTLEANKIEKDRISKFSRDQSNKNLVNLSKKVDEKVTWENLVLADDVKNQLKEMAAMFKYRQQLYDTWNLSANGSCCKGISGLFHGPSGTGKTAAAEVLASELNLNLYKFDLSGIISKYIGETEKNLEEILNKEEYSNSILFFDKADCLFGKSSQVKDGHDRAANIEIEYLLQKMEEYNGIIIMTSNIQNSIDDPLRRRIKYTIKFDKPKVEERNQIWKQIFPQGAQLNSNIDYEFLAHNFNYSGGDIKNIALKAMFLAVDEGSDSVKMRHIILSAKRYEIRKQYRSKDLLSEKTKKEKNYNHSAGMSHNGNIKEKTEYSEEEEEVISFMSRGYKVADNF